MLEVQNLIDAKEYLSKFDVVIFDLDDTLYSEKDYIKSGYKEIAKQFPQIDGMFEKLWNAFETGEKAFDYVLLNEGKYSKEQVLFCLDIYRNHMPNITIYEEAKTLIEYLKKQTIPMGIITDGRPEGQEAKIRALGIESFFEKIIITDELGGIDFRKPSTVPFEIMQHFFEVPYNRMVYIGDNPKKDFVAPIKLGMDFVYFKNVKGLYSI